MSALCCIMPPCHTPHCTTRKLTTKTMHNMGEKFAMLLRESLHCITAMCIYIQRCSKIQLLIMCVMCILQPAGKWFLIYWYCYSCYTYIPITNLILFLKLNCYFFCHRMSQKEYAFYNGYFFLVLDALVEVSVVAAPCPMEISSVLEGVEPVASVESLNKIWHNYWKDRKNS